MVWRKHTVYFAQSRFQQRPICIEQLVQRKALMGWLGHQLALRVTGKSSRHLVAEELNLQMLLDARGQRIVVSGQRLNAGPVLQMSWALQAYAYADTFDKHQCYDSHQYEPLTSVLRCCRPSRR